MKPLGVLLAGGLSRRMGGGDKGLLPLLGTPVMSHAFDRLKQQTDAVVINANGDPSRFSSFHVPVIADTHTGFAGPLAGVLAGMRYAETCSPCPDFIVTAAADTPFFPEDLVAALLAEAATSETIVLASSNKRKHPVFGLWPVSLAGDLDNWLTTPENRKVLAWVQRHQWGLADFTNASLNGNEIDPFFNINTPDDLETAAKLLTHAAQTG